MEAQPDPAPENSAEKKPSAIEFVKAKLALNPEASFAEIKAQAKCEGVIIYPVVYGRAKALLGLVPTAPYGSKSRARREKAAQAVEPPELEPPVAEPPVDAPAEPSSRAKRARALPSSSDALGPLEGMIENLKAAVRERDRYRAVLQRIAEQIQDELGE